MPAIPGAARRFATQILEDMEAVSEKLLTLSDDIWLFIDHHDPAALEEGYEFIRTYYDKTRTFDQAASELSATIQRFMSVRVESEEQSGEGDRERNERIVQQLNREEPHSIGEDFTYRRPHGFILRGQGTTGITTWRRLFELVCQQLLRDNPERFRALLDNPHGLRGFSRSREAFRSAAEIGEGVFAETNLSANGIRDTLRRLLGTFNIPENELRLFLREDRDAGRDREPGQVQR